MKTLQFTLVLVASLLAIFLLGSQFAQAGNHSLESRCKTKLPLKAPQFGDKAKRIDRKYSGSQKTMKRSEAEYLLKVVWRKMYKQCTGKKITQGQLRYRVDRNMRQIRSDSNFVADAVSPTGQHAKGLLQLIDPVFRHWKVPGYENVFHPLDDLLAAVNIQLNADLVLSVVDGHHYKKNIVDGRHSGWGFHGGDNPYKSFR